MIKGATQVRTSETHPLYINEVVVPMAAAAQDARHSSKTSGRIGLTFCPGKKGKSFTGPDWDRDLQADLDKIAAWGAKRVITLLEKFEFDMLGVPELGTSITARGMAWSHLPISDGQAPEASFDLVWEQKRSEFAGALRQGEGILVHCRGGLGRAGTVTCLLLMDQGLGWQEAMALVRRARPGAVETRGQEVYIAGYRSPRI